MTVCPLRTSLYRPGCSTVAVNLFEHTRMANLLIMSETQGAPRRAKTPYKLAALFYGAHSCDRQSDNHFRVRFSATMGAEPEIEVALV